MHWTTLVPAKFSESADSKGKDMTRRGAGTA